MDGRLTIDFSDQYRQKFSFDWSQRSLYLGRVDGDCVAVLLQSHCGNQELFMKNLVFLRTVTDLTPITVVLEPPRRDCASGSCLKHRENYPSTQISTFSSLEIILRG